MIEISNEQFLQLVKKIVDNHNWPNHPNILKSSLISNICNSEDAFTLFQNVCTYYKQYGKCSEFKMYLGDKQCIKIPQEFLCANNYSNWQKYFKSLELETNKQPFLIYINRAEFFNMKVFQNIKTFMKILFKQAGIPCATIETELFVGQYHKTPGGVHTDPCLNFHFTLEGQKILYIWPNQEFSTFNKIQQKQLHGVEYYLNEEILEQNLKKSQKFEVNAGDIIFFPGKLWHVGESPTFSVCINLAVYFDKIPEQIFLEAIQESLFTNNILPNNFFLTKKVFSEQLIAYQKKALKVLCSRKFKEKINTILLNYCDDFKMKKPLENNEIKGFNQ